MSIKKLTYVIGIAACVCLTAMNIVVLGYIEANKDIYPENIKVIALFATPIALGIVLFIFNSFAGETNAERKN